MLNRHGCWVYRYEPKDFLLFIYIFVWPMAFLALTTIWRMLLLVGTLIGLVIPSFMNLAAMHSVRVGGQTLG